jgi:hypothetical protein
MSELISAGNPDEQDANALDTGFASAGEILPS